MFIITLNANKAITGYTVATKSRYLEQFAGQADKRFLDGSDFRDQTDLAHFIQNWRSYYIDDLNKLRPRVR